MATYGELDNAGFVDLVYLNVLGRLPDDAGRSFWLDRLDTGSNTRGEVMIGFSESPSSSSSPTRCQASCPSGGLSPRLRPFLFVFSLGAGAPRLTNRASGSARNG